MTDVPETLVERAAQAFTDHLAGWQAAEDDEVAARRLLTALHDEGLVYWAEELEQVPDLWVYDGDDIFVAGIPFGGWQRHGEGYKAAAPVHQNSEPVYRLRRGGAA